MIEKDEEVERAELLRTVLRIGAGVAILAFVLSLFDPENDPRVGAAFYGLILALIAILGEVARRGHAVLAARAVAGGLWVVIAVVCVTFGGLRGGNAAAFTVVALMLGVFGRSRHAGIVGALLSSLWCAGIAWLEVHDQLPAPLGPAYSPLNSWTSVSVALVFTAVLQDAAVRSVRRASERAAAHAAERDLALRKSIDAQKMEVIGRLASGVAHDFNNLLMVIGATTESLRLAEGDDERAELIEELDEATSRATLMTRHLVALGQPHGRAPLVLDLAAVVRTFSSLLPRLLGPSVAISTDATQPAWVLATEAGLEQVLLNLAVNAREAMPTGGRLTLTVSVQDDVVLTVQDSGVGMDEETRARIFVPFFTTKASGTGLGLATVADRVHQFGGTIEVTSAPGAGAAFTLRLPRQAAPSNAPSLGLPAPRVALRAARLLVVDDDPRVRRSLTRALEDDGFDVVAVSNGVEALRLLEGPHAFACVVSDVAMPLMDGEALAARLRVLAPSLPVVLISGHAAAPAAEAGRVFVEKPFSRESLLAAIEVAIGEEQVASA